MHVSGLAVSSSKKPAAQLLTSLSTAFVQVYAAPPAALSIVAQADGKAGGYVRRDRQGMRAGKVNGKKGWGAGGGKTGGRQGAKNKNNTSGGGSRKSQ